jgi:hypothetical protein
VWIHVLSTPLIINLTDQDALLYAVDNATKDDIQHVFMCSKLHITVFALWTQVRALMGSIIQMLQELLALSIVALLSP